MAHSGQPLSTGNESCAAALPVSTHEPAGAPHTPLDERTPLPQSSQPVPQRLPLTTRAWKACRATVGKADNPKNRCKAVWIEEHPEADEDEFKIYWNEVKGGFSG